MIWSKDRWNSFRRDAARTVLGACLLAFGATSASVVATAQQPNSSAAPKGAPAAGAVGVAQDAWVKLCMQNEQSGGKKICLVNHEGLEPNTGMVLIAAAVRVAEGDEKRVRTFLDDGGRQRFLGIEMVVQGSLCHPRPLNDRSPRSGRIPDLTEYINRGIEDLPPSG